MSARHPNTETADKTETVPYVYPPDPYDWSWAVRNLVSLADDADMGHDIREILDSAPDFLIEDLAELIWDDEDESETAGDEDLREEVAQLVERFVAYRMRQAIDASEREIYGHCSLTPEQAAFFAMVNNGVDAELAVNIASEVSDAVRLAELDRMLEGREMRMRPSLLQFTRPGVAINPTLWRKMR